VQHTVKGEAGIVDNVVQLAIALDGSIENLGREVVCAYITTYRDGVTTGGLYFVDNRLGLLLVEIADDNLCALVGKKDGRASTDALSSAFGKLIERSADGAN